MAEAKFDIPELDQYTRVPPIKPDAMAHSQPYVAGADHQTKLGYPEELVDDWQTKAIDKMGELLGKYR